MIAFVKLKYNNNWDILRFYKSFGKARVKYFILLLCFYNIVLFHTYSSLDQVPKWFLEKNIFNFIFKMNIYFFILFCWIVAMTILLMTISVKYLEEQSLQKQSVRHKIMIDLARFIFYRPILIAIALKSYIWPRL